MQHITNINDLKSLGREKGLQLLAYKEQNRTLFKFIQRIAPNYVIADRHERHENVMVFRLLEYLGW